MILKLLVSFVLLSLGLLNAEAALSAAVVCEYEILTGDTTPTIYAQVTVTDGTGNKVFIIGCATASAAATTNPETFDMDACPLSWDTEYSLFLSTDEVLTSDDYHITFTCSRNTDPLTDSVGLTVGTNTATVSVTDEVNPTTGMKITLAADPLTGGAVTSAYIGQPLNLFIYLDEPFRNGADGFDIAVSQITVDNSVNPAVTLTGGTHTGCQAVSFWGPVTEVSQGVLKVTFDAFMLVPQTGSEDQQIFEANIVVCAGPDCVDGSGNSLYDCSGATAPFNSPGTQYGRRKREAGNTNGTVMEEVTVKGGVKVLPYENYKAELDVNIKEESAGQMEKCEVCTQKSVIFGVMSVLVLLLLFSIGVSCFLFMRTRKSSKLLDYEREMKGSSNPAYSR